MSEDGFVNCVKNVTHAVVIPKPIWDLLLLNTPSQMNGLFLDQQSVNDDAPNGDVLLTYGSMTRGE